MKDKRTVQKAQATEKTKLISTKKFVWKKVLKWSKLKYFSLFSQEKLWSELITFLSDIFARHFCQKSL